MKHTSRKKVYLLRLIFGLSLSSCLVFSLIFYMIQANTINTQKYQVKNLEKNILNLRHELEEIDSKTADQRSYKNLEKFVQNSQMIKIFQAQYLSFIRKEFAKR
ncbi:hypothetical protein CL633_03695 [bacterium]|mgnify:CR=1 FL=1|nr:hypothetical protein [bacterium]|tara:strand:- start:3101 stop:3412 length:312 start_codon:yes stop_codon:yes gene_type:complete